MSYLIYLQLPFHEPDLSEAGVDLQAMEQLARKQQGYVWHQVLRDRADPTTVVVLSEWESRDHYRAFEHHPEHEQIMRKWAQRMRERESVRKFTTL